MKSTWSPIILVIFLWSLLIGVYSIFHTQLNSDWKMLLYSQLFVIPVLIIGIRFPWWSSLLSGIFSGGILLYLQTNFQDLSFVTSNNLINNAWISSGLIVLQGVGFSFISFFKDIKTQSIFFAKENLTGSIKEIQSQLDKSEQSIQELHKENMKYSTMVMNLTNQSKLLNEKLTHNDVVKSGIEAIHTLIKPDYCAIYTVMIEQPVVIKSEERGTPAENDLPKEINFGQGLIGKVAERQHLIKTGETFETSNQSNYLSYYYTVGIPIAYLHKIRGVIYVENHSSNANDELMFLETMAVFIGMALHNADIVETTYQRSVTDGLTKLYNHEYFTDQLQSTLVNAKRYLHPLSLIILDVDYFKKYNDTNGHQMGDMVLEEVGNILKKSVRGADLVARYGGEEFAVILRETNIQGAIVVAEKIRSSVENYPFAKKDSQPGGNLTCSVGVSTKSDKIFTSEELIEAADQALYRAKHNGRNRVEVADK